MPRVTRGLIAVAAVAVRGVFAFPLWRVTLEARETPGHTAESISLVVYDLDQDRLRIIADLATQVAGSVRVTQQ